MEETVEGNSSVCAHNISWWYKLEGLEKTIEIIEKLEEEAESRAKDMINEGYVEGELNCVIYENDEDHEVRGWWKIE